MTVPKSLLPVPVYIMVCAALSWMALSGLSAGRDALVAMISITGGVAVWMLMICIATSPAAALLGRYPEIRNLLIDARGHTAVFALLTGLLHLGLYAAKKGEWAIVAIEISRPHLATGWIALALIALAAIACVITGIRTHVRARPWIHAALYVIMIPVLAHWWMVEGFGLLAIILQVLPLAGLEALRLAVRFKSGERR